MSMDSASARIMWRPEHRPDMTKAERLVLWPGTLWCEDFDGIGSCCQGICHQGLDHLITVYPESCYSVKHREGKMPDIGFGLHAEVCCGKYEAVKQLPRSFWVRLLCQRDKWSDAHVAQLLATPPEQYYRVSGEIRDYYYRLRNPSSGSSRQSISDSSPYSGSRTVSRGKTVSRGTGISVSKCPSCGQKWSGDVCDNCGHGGGI